MFNKNTALNSFTADFNFNKHSSRVHELTHDARTTHTVKKNIFRYYSFVIFWTFNLTCMIGLLRLQVKEAAMRKPDLQNQAWRSIDGRYGTTFVYYWPLLFVMKVWQYSPAACFTSSFKLGYLMFRYVPCSYFAALLLLSLLKHYGSVYHFLTGNCSGTKEAKL